MTAAFRNRKSSTLMVGFVLAILYCAIYIMFYGILTEPLYLHLSIPGMDLLSSILHALIVAALGTAVCCLFFFLPQKQLVPAAFGWMAFFVIILYLLSAFYFDGADRISLLTAVSLFGLAPVLVGNGTAWLVYRRLQKTQGGE